MQDQIMTIKQSSIFLQLLLEILKLNECCTTFTSHKSSRLTIFPLSRIFSSFMGLSAIASLTVAVANWNGFSEQYTEQFSVLNISLCYHVTQLKAKYGVLLKIFGSFADFYGIFPNFQTKKYNNHQLLSYI